MPLIPGVRPKSPIIWDCGARGHVPAPGLKGLAGTLGAKYAPAACL